MNDVQDYLNLLEQSKNDHFPNTYRGKILLVKILREEQKKLHIRDPDYSTIQDRIEGQLCDAFIFNGRDLEEIAKDTKTPLDVIADIVKRHKKYIEERVLEFYPLRS